MNAPSPAMPALLAAAQTRAKALQDLLLSAAAGDLLLHTQPIMRWAPLAPSHQGKAVGADWRPIIRRTASQEQPNAEAHASATEGSR